MKKAPFPLEERRFPAAYGRLADRITAADELPAFAVLVVRRATLVLTTLLTGHLARLVLLLLTVAAVLLVHALLAGLPVAAALLALRATGLALLAGLAAGVVAALLALRPAGLLLLAGLATTLAIGALLAVAAGLLLLLALPVLAGLLAGLIVHRRSPHAVHRTRISAAAWGQPAGGAQRSRPAPRSVAPAAAWFGQPVALRGGAWA